MNQLARRTACASEPTSGSPFLIAVLTGLGAMAVLAPSGGCDGCVPVVDGPGDPDTDAGTPPETCSLAGVHWEEIEAISEEDPEWHAAYEPRSGHVMHWTGTRVVVWGGRTATEVANTGFFYDPATGDFEPTADAPDDLEEGRRDFDDSNTGLNPYTGLMLVWGGRTNFNEGNDILPATGALLDVVNNVWYDVQDSNPRVPRGRAYVHLVPRGDRWIVWGGNPDMNDSPTTTQSGGRILTTHYYDGNGVPQNLGTTGDDCWSSMGQANAMCPPTAMDLPNELSSRKHGAVVWLGNRMVTWGGAFEHEQVPYPTDGAIYDYGTDAWSTMSAVGAPAGREYPVAAGSPTAFYVFGGADGPLGSPNAVRGDGAIYRLDTNTWEALPTTNAPSARLGRGFWILNRYFFVPQGGTLDPSATPIPLAINEDAALYDSQTGEWIRFTPGNSELVERFQNNVVWTGDRLISWGGTSLADGTLMTGGAQLVLPSCL